MQEGRGGYTLVRTVGTRERRVARNITYQLLNRRSTNASKCRGTIHRSRSSEEQTSFSFGPASSGNNYNPENAVQMINDQYNGLLHGRFNQQRRITRRGEGHSGVLLEQ